MGHKSSCLGAGVVAIALEIHLSLRTANSQHPFGDWLHVGDLLIHKGHGARKCSLLDCGPLFIF